MLESRSRPKIVVDFVFFLVLFNVLSLALGFGIIAAIADLSASVSGNLTLLFGSASGSMALLATFIGTIRTAIIRFLDSMVYNPQTETQSAAGGLNSTQNTESDTNRDKEFETE